MACLWPRLDNTSLYIDYTGESFNILVILFGFMLLSLKGH